MIPPEEEFDSNVNDLKSGFVFKWQNHAIGDKLLETAER